MSICDFYFYLLLIRIQYKRILNKNKNVTCTSRYTLPLNKIRNSGIYNLEEICDRGVKKVIIKTIKI